MQTLNDALEWAAQEFGSKPAVRCREETLSYDQLEQRSSALARALIADGVTPGNRVGIHLPRCLESVIAVHGIMRAGAAWVPMDPGLPARRLSFMVRDCDLQRVVTDEAGATRLVKLENPPRRLFGPETSEIRSDSWDAILSNDDDVSLPSPDPDDLAYIMYTSGSTGVPKGICHTHRSGLAYAVAAAEEFQVVSADRLSGFPPLHFDQCTFHLFSGVLRGACTVLVPDEYGVFPVNLGRLMAEESMTIWYSVPFVLMQVANRGNLEELDLSALRCIKFGGEVFPAKYLARWMKALPQARFSNIYGPAEVNHCVHHDVREIPEEDDAIPIGFPWQAADIRIDSSEQGSVPEPGTTSPESRTGELLVRTETMMRGYWNRPDLDDQCFLSDKQGIWFRTGDRVQRDGTGPLLFLGRLDRQVKTRGFRVELDEVEAALLSHEGVLETAVYLVPGPDDSQVLEAAIIPQPGTSLDAPMLGKHLRERLASYAIPTHFNFAATFPRTGSGKIDRRRLAEDRGQISEVKA